MCNPAALLFRDFEGFCVGETDYFIITFLLNEFAEIYRSTINSDGCSCLQPLDLKTEFFELFTDAMTGHLTHSATREMLFTNMNQTIHLVAVKKKPYHHVLPKVDIGCLFQHTAPFSRKHHLVALAPWTPHSGTFRFVEHPKLDHSTVADNARITTHGIDFADDLPLGNTAHGRVARHGGKQPQVHGDEQDFAAHIGCRCRCFAPRVTSPYNDNIIRFKIHSFVSVSRETLFITL